jgi:hypothetical protein
MTTQGDKDAPQRVQDLCLWQGATMTKQRDKDALQCVPQPRGTTSDATPALLCVPQPRGRDLRRHPRTAVRPSRQEDATSDATPALLCVPP